MGFQTPVTVLAAVGLLMLNVCARDQEEPGVPCFREPFLLLGRRHGEDIAQLDTTTALLLVSHRGMVTPGGQRTVILFAGKRGKSNRRY